jgi:hypothetical protein
MPPRETDGNYRNCSPAGFRFFRLCRQSYASPHSYHFENGKAFSYRDSHANADSSK